MKTAKELHEDPEVHLVSSHGSRTLGYEHFSLRTKQTTKRNYLVLWLNHQPHTRALSAIPPGTPPSIAEAAENIIVFNLLKSVMDNVQVIEEEDSLASLHHDEK